MTLFATKPIAALRAQAEASGEHALTRALGPLNLVTLGIGAVIGAGIFVITGQVAALYAGPAVPLSMMLVGVACAFAGLCYAEMASAVPVAGSAYTYAYATLGELVAWIIGWDLILDRKSTRLNSSHTVTSYAVFCLKKKIRSFAASWLLNALLRIFAMSIITPKRKELRMSVQDCCRTEERRVGKECRSRWSP